MKGKKLMAFLLSVMMIVTMIPLTAFGHEGIGDKKEPVQAVKAHKTAELLQDEKTAEITLTVKGKPGTTANIGADVVLVVDNSGSMNSGVPCKNKNFTEENGGPWHYYKCTECGTRFDTKPDFCTGYVQNVQRMTVAKNASHSFVEKILQEPGNDNKVAIIPFEGKVPEASWYDWTESRYALDFTTEKGNLNKCIDKMHAEGGTSYTAALKKAQEFINDRKDTTRPVYIVMMSDGAPGPSGGPEYIDKKKYNGTVQARELIDSGVTIYSVGISLSKNWEEDAMKAVASKLNGNPLYQNVGNENLATDLQGVLEGIAGEVMSSGKKASIVDCINSEDFDINTVVIPEAYQEKLKYEEGKLTWDIGTIDEEEQAVTFTVKLKEESLERGGTFYTNEDVTLSYTGSDGEKYQQDKEIIGHPQVTVLGKVRVTFKTQSEKGEVEGFEAISDENLPYDYQKVIEGIKGTALKEILGDSGFPEVTPKEGYVFKGWYTEEIDGTKVEETDEIINSDRTLYAHFVLNKYTVTFKPGEYGLLNEKKENVVIEGILHGATWSEAITQLPVIKPNSGWIVNSKESWSPLLPKEDTPIIETLTFTAQYNPTYTIEYLTLEDYLNDKDPFERKVKEITSGTVLKGTEIPQAEGKSIPEGYKKVFIVGIPETGISEPGTVVKVVYDKTSKEPTIVPVEKDNVAIVGVRHIVVDGKIPELSTWEEYQLPINKEVEVNSLCDNPDYAGYKVSKATLTIKNAFGTKEGPTEVSQPPVKVTGLKAKAEYVVTYVYEKENTINITDRYDKDVQRSSMTWKKDETYTIKPQFSGRYTMVMKVTVNGKEVSLTNGNLVINQKFLEDNQIMVGEDNKLNIVFTYKKKSSGGGGGGGSSSNEKPTIIDEPKIPLSALETDEHFAYVFGYPDDTVKPENFISREEVTSIFYRLLKDEVRESFFTTKHEYLDVVMDRWSNKSIATLKNGAIITGYPDGEFKPARSITRAEFATIASKFDNLSVTENDMFSDVSDHWANKYINSAAQKGWIHGYPDGTFKPDQNITRAEAMTLINNVLNRRVEKEGILPNAKVWKDAGMDSWYFKEVMEATNSHDYERPDATSVEKWTKLNENKVWNE